MKQKKVTIQSATSSGKYRFKNTFMLRNSPYVKEEVFLMAKLIPLLHQIEQLKLEKLQLTVFNSSSPEEIIENQKKVEDEINRKLKIERLKNFRKRAKKNALILDGYIDSKVFPIQRNEEGEWTYSHTTTNFDHTKTFGRAEVARHMIKIAADAIAMCSSMKEYLLERQLNSWASDIGEDICEIQKKLLIMQEAFLFGTPICNLQRLGVTRITNEIDESTRRMYEIFTKRQVSEFESMKIDLELNEVPKQFIFEDCIFRNDVESASSKNAVANSYFFQCLEQELRAQLYSFIKVIDDWRQMRESWSLELHLQNQLIIDGFVPEFEVKTYDAEGEKKITTTNLLLLEMLGNEGELFQQEQRVRKLLDNNHEIPYYFFCTDTLCEETEIPVFEWINFSARCKKEWKKKIKKFEQKRDSLVQEVKKLAHQLEEKRRSEETKKLSESSNIITDEALLQTNITSEEKEDHFEENKSQQQLTATLELEVTKETTKTIIEIKNETSESPNFPEDKAAVKVEETDEVPQQENKKQLTASSEKIEESLDFLTEEQNKLEQDSLKQKYYPKQELDENKTSVESSVFLKTQTTVIVSSFSFLVGTIIFILVNIKKFF